MRNNKKLYSEVSRMIELTENNQNKSKLLKESFGNKVMYKKILKESIDDIDFTDIFDMSDESEKDMDSKIDSKFSSLSPNDDISLLGKLALATGSINKLQAAMFDLEKKDTLTLKDLSSERVKRDDDKGSVFDKGRKPLYPGQSVADFKDMMKKGRLILKVGNESENLDGENVDKVFKWLGGTKGEKSLHNIGFGSNGKLSKKGNAELNFLARMVSDKPKDEAEQKILDTFGSAAKNNALSILKDFYTVVAKNTLLSLLNMEPTPENLDTISDGVNEAITNLAGVSGGDLEKKPTSWDSSRNIGPWILQVAKNYAKNVLKKDTEYVPNLNSARQFFQDMMDREGVISIISRKEPSHENYADEVEKVGSKYLYKYSKIEDAIDDLLNSSKVKNHHLKSYNLDISKSKDLFSSERKAPVSMSPEMEKETGEMIADEDAILGIDKDSELKIRNILSKVVDFMTLDSKKYGIKQATHDPLYLSGKDKEEIKSGKDEGLIRRRKELAKENAVNFMYNFLLSAIGDTKYGTDIGISGKVNPEVMQNWIDGQRKSILTKLIDIEKKNNPNIDSEKIKERAEELGLLIKGGKMSQSFKSGLKDYFSANKKDLSKVMELISSTSPEGYEVETDIETIFEQKVRAKIQNIIKESFVVKEEEYEDNNTEEEELDNLINVFGDRFGKSTSYERGGKNGLDNEIKSIIDGNKSKWHFENSEKGQHNYITSVLASMYNSLSSSQQRNVLKHIFLSFFPRGEESRIVTQLTNKQVPGSMMSNKSDMWDVIISSEDDGVLLLQKALETYEPKGSLFKYLLRRILNEAKNRTRKFDASVHKGERTYHSSYTDSIDAPIGSDEDGSKAFELEAEDAVDERKERAKHTLSRVLSTLRDKLSKSQINLLMAINDMGDDAFGPDGKLVYGLIGTRTGLSDSNVGSTMSSILKMARELKDKGSL